jgi:hypothetical protein
MTPILIVSSSEHPANDVVVMRSEDAFAFYPNTISTVDKKQWKQIHIDFAEFICHRNRSFENQYGPERHIPVHKTEVVSNGRSYHFTLSHLQDFHKYASS